MLAQTESVQPVRLAVFTCMALVIGIAGCWSEQPVERLLPTEAADSPLPILGQVSAFTLHDQSGAAYGTVSLFGHFWIASFADVNASSKLPSSLSLLASEVSRRPDGRDIRLVTFTSSSQTLSSEALSQIATKSEVDRQVWRLLTGPNDKLASIRQDFASKASVDKPENYLFLVDAEGQLRGFFSRDTTKEMQAILTGFDQAIAERNPVPAEILDPSWMAGRQRTQVQASQDLNVFCDFGFTDQVEESGIRFRNQIVDDAGKYYKAVHYDHGNGIAIADVDGDGLLDLYFSSQLGSNGLWRNRGDGTFEEMPSSSGIALADRVGVSASFADVDNDGDADLYVTSVRGGNLLFLNDGTGSFQDVTEESGLGYVGHSSGAVFFDYDRDGLLDLFLCNVGVYTTDERGAGGYYVGFQDAFAGHLKPEERNEQSILFHNLGDHRFENVSKKMKLEDVSWTGDASPLDKNEDGWPDLYVLNMQGHDEYYENVEGQYFEKKSLEVFPNTPWGSMGIKVFDIENDGDLDIFLTDMHSDMSTNVGPSSEGLKAVMSWPPRFVQAGEFNPQPGRENIWGNALFRNEGEGTYHEVSGELGTENYWPWGLSVGDLNADGFEDVFIASSMSYSFRYAINSLLLNDHGKQFVSSEFRLGIEPRREGRTAIPWFTLDCSGTDKAHPDCKGRLGRTVVWSAVGTKSSVIFDIDNDGDLDIVTNESNDWPMVLVSNLAKKKRDLNFLQIRLVGTKSNRDGLGARVVVTTPAGIQTQVHDGVTGYLSHGVTPLYFGLGDAEKVEQVKVVWPSGTEQVISSPIQIKSTLIITEDE